jgi:hypothetical protein
MVSAAGLELEPLCGRLSPQAKSERSEGSEPYFDAERE